ncbi:DUF1707 domain-containing protein [Streptomyces sp. NPDC048172]|uniref:DUF1707 SHOCT-like domain-containing protein n=1 Tax=Streptomyces sp. NPDC048172 TaxID=3365505 RepID=UPI00371830D9
MPRHPTFLTNCDAPAPATTRASDADRNLVLTILDTALANGRLNQEEHDSRSSAALAARTLGDLASVTYDLPEAEDHAREVRGAQQRVAALKVWARRWRIWLQAVVCLSAIWGVDSLARHELTYCWPVFPLGIWSALLVASMLATLTTPEAPAADQLAPK